MSTWAIVSEKLAGHRMLVAFLAAVVGLVIWASPAAAHVDFLGSTPANISTVSGPISEIVLEYSGEAKPIESDFRIESAVGESLAIASVTNDGLTRVVVKSREPLPDGRTKVVWALRGADEHKMSGSISFTVTQSESVVPPTTMQGNSSNTTAIPSTSVVVSSDDGGLSIGKSDGTGIAETIGVGARWIVYGSILLTVGALAYLLWVHRGSKSEGRKIVFFIRRAAALVVFGAVVEWFAQLALWGSGSLGDLVRPSNWGELLTTGFALGTLLRIVGAALVLKYVAIEVVPDRGIQAAARTDLGWIADIEESTPLLVEDRAQTTTLTRVRVESGPLALFGAFLLVISESFIGHTASVEPRALVAASDAVHLTAAGIWAAGAWLLTATLWRRHRRGQPLEASLLATRFSILATWSLIAVALTGVALAWAILDQPSALWESEFGRLLLLKTVFVFVIGCFGLHNRRTLVPALTSGDETAQEKFRKTITVESALFVFVLLITSFLVIANPFS